MREKDMAILLQGIALGQCIGLASGMNKLWGIGAAVLLLCSLVLTIWRLR